MKRKKKFLSFLKRIFVQVCGFPWLGVRRLGRHKAQRHKATATVSFAGTVKTDPVPVPGALDATAVIDNSVPSPDDLIIVKGTIRESDNYKVPCLHLIAGSWYDNMNDQVKYQYT